MFKLKLNSKSLLKVPGQSALASNSNQSGQPKRLKRNPHYPFTEEGIRKRAHQVYERRLEQGLEGTPKGDWQQAIRELKWERSRLRKFYRWTGIPEKKGWDLVQLLTSISIPVVIFAGGSLFTYWNSQQQQRIAVENRRQDLQIADDNRKQEILNNYLDQMAESLKDGLLKAPPGSEQFIIAQSRTVTALLSLDRKRQNILIQFLSASGLNQKGNVINTGKDGKVQLGKGDQVLLFKAQMAKANLANSDLSGAKLIGANLEGANFGCIPLDSQDSNQCSDLSDVQLTSSNLIKAKLNGADLSNANLGDTNLKDAEFRNANLFGARFWQANLTGANFEGAKLLGTNFIEVDLSGANLEGANLESAYFWRTSLRGANLRKASLLHISFIGTDLTGVKNWTDEQLSQSLLCKTKLPKGSKLDPNRHCKPLLF